MTKDAVATMGNVLPEDAGGRDAVHVAVISVITGEILCAGEHVGFLDGEPREEGLVSAGATTLLGIIDPFLVNTVRAGHRVWLFLYPRTITGLNHRWTHPAFPEDSETVDSIYARPARRIISEQWLRDFCENANCPGYDTVMAAIENILDGKNSIVINDDDDDEYGEDSLSFSLDKEYFHFGGRDAGGEIPDEFWDHVEVVLGKKIKNRAKHFSCSC
jgi:hypothetical protein